MKTVVVSSEDGFIGWTCFRVPDDWQLTHDTAVEAACTLDDSREYDHSVVQGSIAEVFVGTDQRNTPVSIEIVDQPVQGLWQREELNIL